MKKTFILGTLLLTLLTGCGSSDESTVKKYLPGTYTRAEKVGNNTMVGYLGYFKELKIQHLSKNKYRISCTRNDKLDINGKILKIYTPDIFDIEISSIEPKQKSNSIQEYYIKSFVTNVIQDGTTFSDADNGINTKNFMNFFIGKDVVEVKVVGNSLSSIRKK